MMPIFALLLCITPLVAPDNQKCFVLENQLSSMKACQARADEIKDQVAQQFSSIPSLKALVCISLERKQESI